MTTACYNIIIANFVAQATDSRQHSRLFGRSSNLFSRYCMPRGRGPSTYRVRDLEMAIRAVQKRGLNVARVEIAQDGRIVIVAGEPTSMHTPNVADDWEDAR
jgi:hypothetical protein